MRFLVSTKDFLSGLIFVAIGAFFCIGALIDLRLGTAFQMGPGYFPTMVGGILMVLGVAIILQSLGSGLPPADNELPISRRAVILITLAPIVFGITIRGLGLVPSLALAIMIAAFSSRRMTIPLALALSAGLTLFCVAVFNFGLGLPLRLFGPWLPV